MPGRAGRAHQIMFIDSSVRTSLEAPHVIFDGQMHVRTRRVRSLVSEACLFWCITGALLNVQSITQIPGP